jgi:hypothetical protein
MNYAVEWTPSAHDRLERLWMAADDNRSILRAANAIDNFLANDPYGKEAIVVGEENTFIVEPLAVDYQVLEDQKRVLVLSVWMIGNLKNDSM